MTPFHASVLIRVCNRFHFLKKFIPLSRPKFTVLIVFLPFWFSQKIDRMLSINKESYNLSLALFGIQDLIKKDLKLSALNTYDELSRKLSRLKIRRVQN